MERYGLDFLEEKEFNDEIFSAFGVSTSPRPEDDYYYNRPLIKKYIFTNTDDEIFYVENDIPIRATKKIDMNLKEKGILGVKYFMFENINKQFLNFMLRYLEKKNNIYLSDRVFDEIKEYITKKLNDEFFIYNNHLKIRLYSFISKEDLENYRMVEFLDGILVNDKEFLLNDDIKKLKKRTGTMSIEIDLLSKPSKKFYGFLFGEFINLPISKLNLKEKDKLVLTFKVDNSVMRRKVLSMDETKKINGLFDNDKDKEFINRIEDIIKIKNDLEIKLIELKTKLVDAIKKFIEDENYNKAKLLELMTIYEKARANLYSANAAVVKANASIEKAKVDLAKAEYEREKAEESAALKDFSDLIKFIKSI